MRIIVWEHKHGTSYFDASTDEALDASSREIIRSLMYEMEYIFPPEDSMENIRYSGIDMEQAELTDEQIAALPTESLRKVAQGHKTRLAKRKRQYEDDLQDFKYAQKLANGEKATYRTRNRKTGEETERELTAWQFVQSRSGYEYENFSLEFVWEPETKNE